MNLPIGQRPKRIQRQRTKGWRLPPNAVYVGRPTRWGNPFSITKHGRHAALEYFRSYLTGHSLELLPRQALGEYRAAEKRLYGKAPATLYPGELAAIFLRGRSLACWCSLCGEHADGLPCGVVCVYCAPCHADVLLEVANR